MLAKKLGVVGGGIITWNNPELVKDMWDTTEGDAVVTRVVEPLP